MNIDQISEWIVMNPRVYPGLHQESNQRTSEAFKPLEPKSQILVIWKAFCEYIGERLNDYKGINIKNFGAFTYEVSTELPKIGLEKSKFNTLGELIVEKKTSHNLRPTFIIDNRYKKLLSKFLDKEELIKPKSQHSIFQQGFQMTYCNPTPIAASCYLHKSVINDGLNSIFNSIYDLINLGKNVILKMGFCNIYFTDKNLQYTFAPTLVAGLTNKMASQSKLKRGITPVCQTWKTTAISKWAKSSLSSVLERPHTPLVKTIDNKTQMLKIMSLDLASTVKPKDNNYKSNSSNFGNGGDLSIKTNQFKNI